MQPTEISWCDYTWNPVTGCTRYGPECTNCWAEVFTKRQAKRDDAPDYMTDKEWLPQNASEIVTTHDDRLDDPSEYHYPRGPGKIFTVSMGDLFHRLVPREFVEQVVTAARENPAQVFIFLTRRPERAAKHRLDLPENVWVGTSVGSGPGGQYPNTTHRIEQLRDVDASVRWVSFEPLIEPIGEVALDHIDWAVVGGESAGDDDRREMDHRWADEIFKQCRDQDTAFFFKQSSGRLPETGTQLTTFNEDLGVHQQREFREFPELPEVTVRARREMNEVIT